MRRGVANTLIFCEIRSSLRPGFCCSGKTLTVTAVCQSRKLSACELARVYGDDRAKREKNTVHGAGRGAPQDVCVQQPAVNAHAFWGTRLTPIPTTNTFGTATAFFQLFGYLYTTLLLGEVTFPFFLDDGFPMCNSILVVEVLFSCFHLPFLST